MPRINGQATAAKIQAQAAQRIRELKAAGITPRLEVVLVGDDKPSATYVHKKGQAAEAIGMEFKLHELSATTTTKNLVSYIKDIQAAGYLSGLIVQLPLPRHIDTAAALGVIDPTIDVDCLTEVNLGRLMMKNNFLVPPTPGAVMSILEELNIAVSGKNVTIVGMGPLVGKPLAVMMINDGASVTTVNSRTSGAKEKCLAADIIVTGVGKKDVLRGDMVRFGAVVIDTGVDFVDKKMYGDVNVAEVETVAAWVTPTPGGVGPITVARLLWNTVLCAEKLSEKRIAG